MGIKSKNIILIIVLVFVSILLVKSIFTTETEKQLERYLFGYSSNKVSSVSLVEGEGETNTYWRSTIAEIADMSYVDTLTVNVAITYFTNEEDVPISVEYIKRSVELQNSLLFNNGSNIKINLLPIKVVLGTPKSNNEEVPIKYKNVDISKYRYSANYWSEKYYQEGAINAFIYNDDRGDGVAMAYGIPSTAFKMRLSAIHPKYVTFLHELLHCLGLRHTHEYDNSGHVYSVSSGDRIGDTPAVCPLTGLVDEDCELLKNWRGIRIARKEGEVLKSNPLSNIDSLSLYDRKVMTRNIMAYTFKPCRTHITNEQLAKIFHTVATNADVRNTISEYRKGFISKQNNF